MIEVKDQYPEDHLQSFDNMKVLGKFKDKCKGQLVLNFIGLYPKLYTFDYEREADFDVDENGIEVILMANKNTAKEEKVEVAK